MRNIIIAGILFGSPILSTAGQYDLTCIAKALHYFQSRAYKKHTKGNHGTSTMKRVIGERVITNGKECEERRTFNYNDLVVSIRVMNSNDLVLKNTMQHYEYIGIIDRLTQDIWLNESEKKK